eukprot:scaffold70_cov242-Pinguiococcus_pyrenoidosus.AAC.11
MLRRGSRRVSLASNSSDISRFIGSLRVTTVHVPPANRLLGANYGIQKRRFSHSISKKGFVFLGVSLHAHQMEKQQKSVEYRLEKLEYVVEIFLLLARTTALAAAEQS